LGGSVEVDVAPLPTNQLKIKQTLEANGQVVENPIKFLCVEPPKTPSANPVSERRNGRSI
jgi:hypothetical protein